MADTRLAARDKKERVPPPSTGRLGGDGSKLNAAAPILTPTLSLKERERSACGTALSWCMSFFHHSSRGHHATSRRGTSCIAFTACSALLCASAFGLLV